MTKGDRRNFKLFAQLQDGDKKYIQVFDAIEKQTDYDEKKLLKQFEGERFTKQFSVAKNYLYRYILKTLHIFHKDPHSELVTLIHQVRILMGKNLFDQAQKLLRKAKHKAEDQEAFKELLALLQMEREIYFHNKKLNQFEAFIQDIQEKELDYVAKVENLIHYKHLQDQTRLCKKRIREARNKGDLQPFREILENPLVASPDQPLSNRARIQRFAILCDCALYEGRFEDCEEYSGRIIELFEANPGIREVDNLMYLLELSYLSGFQYRNGKHDLAYETLERLRNATTLSHQEQLRIFEKYSQITLAIALERGDLKNGREAALTIEQEFGQMEGKIRKAIELSLFFHLAYFWLIAGEPSQALKWINRLLNEPKTELRVDLQCMARILNLIIHYELGNRDLVEYSAKSAYRFIYKRKRLFKFEQFALRIVRKLNESFEEGEADRILKDGMEEFQEILSDPFESKALVLFDIHSWMKARLRKVPLAVIKQEKVAATEAAEKV